MDLSSLQQQIGLHSTAKQPPVEQWNPELSGDIDIVIRADGSWWHEGRAFERQDLVRLFASILRHESPDYFVLTPVEKWRIQVEDRPFVVTLVAADTNGIEFVTRRKPDTLTIEGNTMNRFRSLIGAVLIEDLCV